MMIPLLYIAPAPDSEFGFCIRNSTINRYRWASKIRISHRRAARALTVFILSMITITPSRELQFQVKHFTISVYHSIFTMIDRQSFLPMNLFHFSFRPLRLYTVGGEELSREEVKPVKESEILYNRSCEQLFIFRLLPSEETS